MALDPYGIPQPDYFLGRPVTFTDTGLPSATTTSATFANVAGTEVEFISGTLETVFFVSIISSTFGSGFGEVEWRLNFVPKFGGQEFNSSDDANYRLVHNSLNQERTSAFSTKISGIDFPFFDGGVTLLCNLQFRRFAGTATISATGKTYNFMAQPYNFGAYFPG